MAVATQVEVYKHELSGLWVTAEVEEVELGDHYQFWLAYMAHSYGANRRDRWYALEEPWHTLIQRGLLYITNTLSKPVGTPGKLGDLHRFAVTDKGEDFLRSMDPSIVVAGAVHKEFWRMAADWMAELSPEHLPAYLSHGSVIVREMALSRARFLEQHGWPNKEE